MSNGGQSAFSREKGSRAMNPLPRGQTRRLELVGEYDLTQQDELGALFRALPPDGPATIDMSRVTYVDSSFLHELTRLRTRLIPYRVTLLVRTESIRRLLKLANFDLLFEIKTL